MEFDGALYATSRGNNREVIVSNDTARALLLGTVAQVNEHFHGI
jgi:hypothetical protein